ncbi:MAG TPA: hypothetical protein PLC65_02075, partial [Bacteroidia bacterium]|nr:hypothetical protein [Bacteroidia bacterium]
TETYDYLNEKGTKPVEEAGQFKINNYETAALKDELKSREQFNGNTLNNNIGGKAGDTPKSRYEKAINSPKSKDLTK